MLTLGVVYRSANLVEVDGRPVGVVVAVALVSSGNYLRADKGTVLFWNAGRQVLVEFVEYSLNVCAALAGGNGERL